MEEALQIYKKLLEKGEVSRKEDKELFQSYMENLEVKEILEKFERELDFKIVDTPRTLYLVPNIENKVLGISLREIRESIQSDAKLIDTFCFVILLCLFCIYFMEVKMQILNKRIFYK